MTQIPAVDIGTPLPGFHEWVTAEVRYHGFAGLPSTRGRSVKSPEFTCFGRRWHLLVYPGGRRESKDGMVAVYLHNDSNQGIKIKNGFYVRYFSGSTAAKSYLTIDYFHPKRSLGYENFATRLDLIGSLVEGTLLIEVRIKLIEGKNMMYPIPFVPENPSPCKIIEDLFMDENSADVLFEVEEQPRKRGMTENATSTFYAHRLILKKCSSTLAELCASGEDNLNPIPITDVKPGVFLHLLHYIYGGAISNDDLKSHAKEIIDAADKYGVTNLKLEAEAVYVQSTAMTVGNVLDHLLYAEAKNCALLKEASMDFIVENKVEVLKQVALKDVPAGMFADALAAVARAEKRNENDKNSSEALFETMGISHLRQKVHEKGLNVDGSRETLITYLKENP